ncbi:putative quinol monooxygenase [Rhizobium halophytocola]|uniref:Quinol monooxygenase YgiN n=1 Tax=Rhizobium halophytocola TaxID=735519 RepID=A0ABS4DWC2_9HYPH|nr:antibiotic biosynthesis monooxygenase [Rhizobium halophytocola]MBP1849999.1 quinol monooxygenase YgiN [Rhizobium halophytocola]
MIVEYLRYEIDAARQAAFVSAYKAAETPLLASPYATSFDLCQCVEDPAHFILRIEWTSAEDHMQRFRASQDFRAFFAHIQPYLKDIREMRHYQRL